MPGAIFTVSGWLIFSRLFNFYVNNFSNYDVIYGSLGGVIVLITWLYLSSWTILAGSEVNARLLYKKRNRTRIKRRSERHDHSRREINK